MIKVYKDNFEQTLKKLDLLEYYSDNIKLISVAINKVIHITITYTRIGKTKEEESYSIDFEKEV